MRTGFLIATAVVLVSAPAMAAGGGASTICSNAGFRIGSASFDNCVIRVSGDDPLAALETADAERIPVTPPGDKAADPAEETLKLLDGDRAKPGMAEVRPPVRDGEVPAVAATVPPPIPGGGLPGGGLPGGGELPGSLPPTAPPPSAPPPSTPVGGGFFVTPPTAPTAPTPPQFNTFTVTMPAWMWGQ